MKRFVIMGLAICIAVMFCACGEPVTVQTGIGEFEYEQVITSELDDDISAEDGNTLLVIYLTPVDGGEMDLDEVREYFYSGTQASVDDTTYDLKCLAYEEVAGRYVRCALIFEVPDNGYSDGDNDPEVSLILP